MEEYLEGKVSFNFSNPLPERPFEPKFLTPKFDFKKMAKYNKTYKYKDLKHDIKLKDYINIESYRDNKNLASINRVLDEEDKMLIRLASFVINEPEMPAADESTFIPVYPDLEFNSFNFTQNDQRNEESNYNHDTNQLLRHGQLNVEKEIESAEPRPKDKSPDFNSVHFTQSGQSIEKSNEDEEMKLSPEFDLKENSLLNDSIETEAGDRDQGNEMPPVDRDMDLANEKSTEKKLHSDDVEMKDSADESKLTIVHSDSNFKSGNFTQISQDYVESKNDCDNDQMLKQDQLHVKKKIESSEFYQTENIRPKEKSFTVRLKPDFNSTNFTHNSKINEESKDDCDIKHLLEQHRLTLEEEMKQIPEFNSIEYFVTTPGDNDKEEKMPLVDRDNNDNDFADEDSTEKCVPSDAEIKDNVDKSKFTLVPSDPDPISANFTQNDQGNEELKDYCDTNQLIGQLLLNVEKIAELSQEPDSKDNPLLNECSVTGVADRDQDNERRLGDQDNSHNDFTNKKSAKKTEKKSKKRKGTNVIEATKLPLLQKPHSDIEIKDNVEKSASNEALEGKPRNKRIRMRPKKFEEYA